MKKKLQIDGDAMGDAASDAGPESPRKKRGRPKKSDVSKSPAKPSTPSTTVLGKRKRGRPAQVKETMSASSLEESPHSSRAVKIAKLGSDASAEEVTERVSPGADNQDTGSAAE